MKSNLLSAARTALGIAKPDASSVVSYGHSHQSPESVMLEAIGTPDERLDLYDRINQGGQPPLDELIHRLKKSTNSFDNIGAADIETNIAIAAWENAMTLAPAINVAENLGNQMSEYASKIKAAIEEINGQQADADRQHSDALASLNDEIRERTDAHKELTAGNDARIADHKRALAAIEALHVALAPPEQKPAATERRPKLVPPNEPIDPPKN